MLNKTRKLITGTVLSLSAAVLLLLFLSTHASAAAVVPTAGNLTTLTGTGSTINAATTAGGTTANVAWNMGAANAVVGLIVSGVGTTNLGALTAIGDNHGDDRSILSVGDGADGTTVVIVHGAVVANATGDQAVVVDLDILIDAAGGGTAVSHLKLLGAVDLPSGIIMHGDANGEAILTVGDGTTAITVLASTLDMAANTATSATINIASSATLTSAINLSATCPACVINMAADSVITSVIVDGAANTFTVNIDGDAAMSGAGSIVLDQTGTSTIAIDAGMTFTKGGTGLITIDAITLGDAAVLKLDGSSVTTGTVNGAGTIDINSAHSFASIIGASTPVTTIDMATNATFTLAVSASTLNFSADVIAVMTDDVTGNFTASTSGHGEVETAGALTVTGSLGSSTSKLKLFDVNNAVTVSGDIYATTTSLVDDMTLGGDLTGAIAMDGDETLSLLDGADITGAITMASDANGTILVAGTSVITGTAGNDDLKTLTLAANSNLSISAGAEIVTITAAAGSELKLIASGNTQTFISTTGFTATSATLNVGTVLVTWTGAASVAAASTLKATIGTTTGKIVLSDALTTHADTMVEPVLGGAVVSGQEYRIATASNDLSGILPSSSKVTESYERYTFVVGNCAAGNTHLCITPTVVAPAGVSSNSAAVSAIADVAFAGDSSMADAINTLSGTALDKALISLAPAVDGGAIVGAVSAGAASGATISTQMASLRSGIAAGQGLNAGDRAATEERFWTQGFGTYAEQDIREKIAGFTSTTGGAALGVDNRFSNDLVLGVAYSFSHTNVNSSESKNETKVQSHQGTIYGSHDIDKSIFQTDGLFLDGQLSYAYNDYDGERNIEVGAVSRRADSAYDGLQISTKFDLGKTIKLDDGFRFTPTLGLSYSHVSIDSYTETNAAASNLSLQEQDYDILNINLKGKIARTWQVDGIDLTPEVHLGYSLETIQDKIQTLSTFQGGGNAFTSTGFTPANNTYLGGIGVTWGGDSMPVDVTLTYDAAHKDDFLSHSALVKGVWRF